MKFDGEKKYLWWGLTIFITVASLILFYYLIFHISSVISLFKSFFQIIMPIVDGFILAYLLSPIVNYIERKIYKDIFKKKTFSIKAQKRIRFVVVIITIIFFFFIIYKFLSLVVPEVTTNIEVIAKDYPKYLKQMEAWIDKKFFSDEDTLLMMLLFDKSDMEKSFSHFLDNYSGEIEAYLTENFLPRLNDFFLDFTAGILSVIKSIWNFIIGVIISVYLLCDKELYAGQAKKCIYALFKKDTANVFIHNLRFTHKTFIGFFFGKIVDSIIIGLLCFILTTIIGTPYAVLISVIIGVTNVIPFFGPYIGAIPSALLVLMVDPTQFIYFVILIIILQQFDGNILGPKILGESTGITGFWVIFAITLFGGLFDIVGMLVGVPLFAVIYACIKAGIKTKLQLKKLSINTENYLNVDYITEDNQFIEVKHNDENDSESNKGKQINLSFMKYIKNIGKGKKSSERTEDDSNTEKSKENEEIQLVKHNRKK